MESKEYINNEKLRDVRAKGDGRMSELLYTVQDVSKLLKTNETYVRKLIKKGLLKGMVLGRLKVRASALEEFLEKYEGYDVTDVENIKKMDVLE